jgi:subtilisin-like proprotein convertase family protein
MNGFAETLRSPLLLTLLAASCLFSGQRVHGQAGLRESLERLDRNGNGEVDPEEITPLARPYLERVAEARGMSLDRPYSIDRWQEAARIYYALSNGVAGQRVAPDFQPSVREFGPLPDEPLLPDFGLAEIKYPYTQADLDFADRTIASRDRNRDGYIDRREAVDERWTHRDPFDDDLNRDDRLSRLELAQRYARRRLLEGATDELRQKARRMAESDPTPSERQDRGQEESDWWRRDASRYYLTSTVLSRFDLNRNGRLELSEAASLGIPPGRIDANRDGVLSRDELNAMLTEMQDQAGDPSDNLPGWFYELDVNQDQQVTMLEFATEWSDEKVEQFSTLDISHDGLLTAAEIGQSRAMIGGTYENVDAQVLPPRKTIISEIVVNEDYLIADLNVQLSITHTHTAYLDAYLTGPQGQRVELFSEVGGYDDHFDQTILDDQSRYPINKAQPPFQGSFMPEALVNRQPSLSQFNGTSVQGVWQLVVRGTRSDRFGMLHSWGLIVTPLENMLDSPTTESLPEAVSP